ncbi:MAG: 4Fe-4S binding protein [Candidatus Latescibacterota bacterium]|nr:MAG: 4Fe-4S binding protein [Candidatus Latescibacterota bacterium]
MPDKQRPRGPRGLVHIHADECKGCALCVHACPVHGLQIASSRLNRLGYHPVEFVDGCSCTGCGVCFYACPEPGALHVQRQQQLKQAKADGNGSGEEGASTPASTSETEGARS